MFEHISVLKEEAISSLNIKEDGIYVDCTMGGAGHSQEILKQLTTGLLIGFDQDENAIKVADERLSTISDRYILIHRNFQYIKEELEKRHINGVDGILFDLGVSSPQFDEAQRGFSYKKDARLDMRMDQRQSFDAYTLVNTYSYEDLVRIFYHHSDEKYAKPIARAIESYRKTQTITTTLELADIIKDAVPAKYRRNGHPARKVFQAIRIEVNKEFEVLEKALTDSLELLNIKGRCSVITFHSIEDRIVKTIFNNYTKSQLPKNVPVIEDTTVRYKKITRKPILPQAEELERNHRSHSAKLRVIEREKQ